MRTIALVVMLGFGGGCATLSSSSGSASGDTKNQIDVPVQSPPPPEKAEAARPAAPGFGYIWVGGYWDYLDGNYIWRDGRWVQGKPDYEYVRARYDNDAGKGWVFHRPHWKKRQHSGEQAAKPAG
jgi:hypothetical protein